jgi:thiamine pyrophosphate-dependent acetolactate synthase large subunit-like protein
MRVGEAVVDALAELDTELVFGIPGVHTIELYRGIARSGLRAVTARHEQGAGFMADGYARATGRPGVCILITGPGVTNALTPMAQAYHDSVPLLVVGSVTRRCDLGRRRGPLHDLPDKPGSCAASPRSARRSRTPPSSGPPSGAPGRRCSRAARAPYISHYPSTCSRPNASRCAGPRRRPHPTPPTARRCAARPRCWRARRPVLLLGGGAVDAGRPAADIATLLDAPVALTGNAKGAVPFSHPLCLGAVLPFGSVQELIATADAALLVGTELSEVDVIYSGRPLRFGGSVVRVDVDPAQLDSGVRATCGVVGDAGAVLQALLGARREEERVPPTGDGAGRVREALGGMAWTADSEEHMPWLDALQQALPVDRIVALDSTKLAYTAHHYLPAEQPRSWLAPYGFGTLGTALPMAIGAKLAFPDRPVAAVAGDGGLLFTIAELATAVDLRLALPLVVWDNRGYGEIRDSFRPGGGAQDGHGNNRARPAGNRGRLRLRDRRGEHPGDAR